MIDRLDELYREVILDHFKRSSRHGVLPGAQIKVDGTNPLCGDEVTFHLALDGSRIGQVRFEGRGCAISQAASSMLAQQLEGKTVAQARALIQAMKALMQGQDPDAAVDLGDLEGPHGDRQVLFRPGSPLLSRYQLKCP